MTKSNFFVLALLISGATLAAYGVFFAVRQQAKEEPKQSILAVGQVTVPPAGEEDVPLQPESIYEESVEPIEIMPQKQLIDPPEIIQAVYLTGWSAGTRASIDYMLRLEATTDMNAVVIDVKDFSGEVAYDTAVSEAEAYGAENNIKIRDIDSVIQRLHEADIYVIARVTVFQDPILAAARPDLAVQSTSTQAVWKDFKGLSWIDPAAKEAWDYTVAIAKDASSHGFDEINFDYIRFPSDGNLLDMEFPFTDEQILKQEVLAEFFAYLKENLSDITISADLFGLVTIVTDDLGIGQVIEDAYEHFDYVYPMVYPSHYANGFQGYVNPAEHPYEIVQYSLENAVRRLRAVQTEHPEKEFAKIRPWLQDFDLGADYDALMVQAQIQATKDAMGQDFAGFLLWAPTNIYTAGTLHPFVLNKELYDAKFLGAQEEVDFSQN